MVRQRYALGRRGRQRSVDRAWEGKRFLQARGTGCAPRRIVMFVPMKVKHSVVAVGLVFGLSLPLHAMDRWSALSQVESGDNDRAVGSGQGRFPDTRSSPNFGAVTRPPMPIGQTPPMPCSSPSRPCRNAAQPLSARCAGRQRTRSFTSCGTPRRRFSAPAKRCCAAQNDSATWLGPGERRASRLRLPCRRLQRLFQQRLLAWAVG